MDEQLINRLWDLFGLGSARSAGWGDRTTSHAPGSGYIFAYGHHDGTGPTVPAVDIYNAAGDRRRVEPATKQNVLEALIDMGISETEWTL